MVPTTQSLVLLLGVPSIVGEGEEWRGPGMERTVVVGPPLLLTSGCSKMAASRRRRLLFRGEERL
jgi:hypothetical protein